LLAVPGVLPHIQQLAASLTDLIWSGNLGISGSSQQLSQPADLAVADLVHCLLMLFDILMFLWPGDQALYSTALVPVTVAVADLALAVLQHHELFSQLDSSSSSSSSFNHRRSLRYGDTICMINTPVKAAVSAAVRLVKCYDTAATCTTCNSVFECDCGKLKQMPEALRSSSSIQQLLLVVFSIKAVAARANLQRNIGKRACPSCGDCNKHSLTAEDESQLQQLLLVPCYHHQLLAAVGVPGGLDFYEYFGQTYLGAVSFLVSAVTFGMPYPGGAAAEDGQLSSQQQQQQQQRQRPWQRKQKQAAFVAHLLTSLEVGVLRANEPDYVRSTIQDLDMLLSDDRCLLLDIEELLSAVLQYMLPAVQYAESLLDRREDWLKKIKPHTMVMELAELLQQVIETGGLLAGMMLPDTGCVAFLWHHQAADHNQHATSSKALHS
jgi:hypothetical protein